MLSYTNPVAVVLSVLSGVGGWGCPNTVSMCLIGMAVVVLWKMPATSASANDETTCLSVLLSTRMAPFNFGRFMTFGCSAR